MARQAKNRIEDFEKFFKNSPEKFEKFKALSPRAIELGNEYSFCICPGGRILQNDAHIFELFWGKRPFEIEKNNNGNFTTFFEEGATLYYQRNHFGYVNVVLYPNKTESISPKEDCILLERWLDPIKLLEESKLESHWKFFLAYTEYTSIEGRPTRRHKMTVSYLRFFKNLVIEGKVDETKYSYTLKSLAKYILTVGLSGFIFVIANLLVQPSKNKTEMLLDTTNKRLEDIHLQLKLNSGDREKLQSISRKTDSINVRTREALDLIKGVTQNKK